MIKFEVDGRTAVITLDRSEARNAINTAMAEAIEVAIDRLEEDDDLWVGILTHEGPAFCAGADLKEVAAGRGGSLSTARGGFAGIVLRERTKPLIASIEGPAVAGGLEIALSCDLRVASTSASFGIPEVKRSLLAVFGGLSRLPKIVPPAIAMEMALTGDPIDAQRAFELGLINRVCEPGEALDEALMLASRIAANAPLAVRASRTLILKSLFHDDSEAMDTAGAALLDLIDTDDFAAEGPTAFIEKRAAVWRAR